jgi:hypothetical protein
MSQAVRNQGFSMYCKLKVWCKIESKDIVLTIPKSIFNCAFVTFTGGNLNTHFFDINSGLAPVSNAITLIVNTDA